MKSIILVAMLCATALALPSEPVGHKKSLIQIYQEKVAPKMSSLQVPKINKAKIYDLLEAPGLRELVDQAFDSAEMIYMAIGRASGKLVPLFKEYNLNDAVVAELPTIVQRVSLQDYEAMAEFIRFLRFWRIITPEQAVMLFIGGGIGGSALYTPFNTYDQVYNLIYGIDKTAGREFMRIWDDLMWSSFDHGWLFVEVLLEALAALEEKH